MRMLGKGGLELGFICNLVAKRSYLHMCFDARGLPRYINNNLDAEVHRIRFEKKLKKGTLNAHIRCARWLL